MLARLEINKLLGLTWLKVKFELKLSNQIENKTKTNGMVIQINNDIKDVFLARSNTSQILTDLSPPGSKCAD